VGMRIKRGDVATFPLHTAGILADPLTHFMYAYMIER